ADDEADAASRRYASSQVSYIDCATRAIMPREGIDMACSFDRDLEILGGSCSSPCCLVRLDGQSRDPPECAVSGDEPLAVPLADRRDEQVRRGHLLAPFDEEGAQASSLRV